MRKREHNPAPPRAPLRAAAGAPRRRIQAAPGPRRTDRPPCAGGGNRANLPVKGGPGECPPGRQGGAAYSPRSGGTAPRRAPEVAAGGGAHAAAVRTRGRQAPPAGRGRGGPQAAQPKATPGAVPGGDVPAGRSSGAVVGAAVLIRRGVVQCRCGSWESSTARALLGGRAFVCVVPGLRISSIPASIRRDDGQR